MEHTFDFRGKGEEPTGIGEGAVPHLRQSDFSRKTPAVDQLSPQLAFERLNASCDTRLRATQLLGSATEVIGNRNYVKSLQLAQVEHGGTLQHRLSALAVTNADSVINGGHKDLTVPDLS